MSRNYKRSLIFFILLLWSTTAFAVENKAFILFDQGHNQRFLIEEKGDLQLSKLAGIMQNQGALVASTGEILTDVLLKDVAAVVISGPFEALRPEEVEAVVRFVERGGRLAVMLHIGHPVDGLLGRLGLDYSNAVLHERHNVIDTDLNFRVTNFAESPLFSGLTRFSVFGCWALNPGQNGVQEAKTSTDSWVDLDGDRLLSKADITQTFAVVVSGSLGGGQFVVFGDDAIFQNRYLDPDNSRLAANLAIWLTGVR